MEPGLQLEKSPDSSPVDEVLKHRYLQAIGSLMYAMVGTRPDLCHAVGYLSRFSACPSKEHWTAVVHVFRYIKATLDLGLYYSRAALAAWAAYSDCNWGACINTSRSTMDFVFLYSGASICWASKLQSRIAYSSTEAEYLGLNFASKQAIYLGSQLGELSEPLPSPLILFGDNQGANALSKEGRFHQRTKHIRMNEHAVREYSERKEIAVVYVETGKMVADVMTKALGATLFAVNRDRLGLRLMPTR